MRDMRRENSEKEEEEILQETYTVSTRITSQMYASINKILESGAYLNITDYLRSVVRDDLQKRGLLTVP
jgi:Arc/MetJ-type ribon-helix-helix transcriptional regulator